MAENQVPRNPILLNVDEVPDTLLATLHSRLLDRRTIDADGCWLSGYALNKPGHTNKLIFNQNNNIVNIQVEKGYPKIRLITAKKGERLMIYAHHLSFMFHNRHLRKNKAFQDKWNDPSYDVSHRCGKPKCFHGHCLVCEHHNNNITRDYCHGLNKPGICPHDPVCKNRSL